MQVAEAFRIDPERMMKTPFRRFLAYQRLLMRRGVEDRNRRARQDFEEKLARER